MSASFPPVPPNQPWPRSAQRPDDTRAIDILTVLVVLGVLILLGLAFSGLIWTPWQTFPAQTSEAGVLAVHALDVIVSMFFGGPVALGVIACGHVALLLVRRRARTRPDSKGPRTAFVTLLLVSGLVVGYVALAMQVYFHFAAKLTD